MLDTFICMFHFHKLIVAFFEIVQSFFTFNKTHSNKWLAIPFFFWTKTRMVAWFGSSTRMRPLESTARSSPLAFSANCSGPATTRSWWASRFSPATISGPRYRSCWAVTKVKICGITNIEDAKKVVEVGADALGFVFYEKSPEILPKKRRKRL